MYSILLVIRIMSLNNIIFLFVFCLREDHIFVLEILCNNPAVLDDGFDPEMLPLSVSAVWWNTFQLKLFQNKTLHLSNEPPHLPNEPPHLLIEKPHLPNLPHLPNEPPHLPSEPLHRRNEPLQ